MEITEPDEPVWRNRKDVRRVGDLIRPFRRVGVVRLDIPELTEYDFERGLCSGEPNEVVTEATDPRFDLLWCVSLRVQRDEHWGNPGPFLRPQLIEGAAQGGHAQRANVRTRCVSEEDEGQAALQFLPQVEELSVLVD